MKLLTLKMKLAEAMKKRNVVYDIIKLLVVWGLATGIICIDRYFAYWNGFTDGVERTEQCLDHWGKMKHDGWNFYCID